VHIFSEDDPPIGYVKPIVAPAAQSWITTLAPYIWAGTAVAVAAMVAKAIGTLVGTPRIEHVEVVLLTAIVAVAVRYGLAASLLATALACFSFDFFFLQPLYSLAIDDPFDVTAFLLFSIVGVIVSNMAARLRAQTHANIDRLHVIEALYSVAPRCDPSIR
jgi:two-component system, OmpR family, sensor histidine kinase KdpD